MTSITNPAKHVSETYIAGQAMLTCATLMSLVYVVTSFIILYYVCKNFKYEKLSNSLIVSVILCVLFYFVGFTMIFMSKSVTPLSSD